jgi:acyl-CoA hydrolase
VVQELCEESLVGLEPQNAEQLSHKIKMDSMDVVKFISRVSVGDIVEFSGHATYVDLKTGKCRIRVVCHSINPVSGKAN